MAGFNKSRWAKKAEEVAPELVATDRFVVFQVRRPKFGKAPFAARIVGANAQYRFSREFLEAREDGRDWQFGTSVAGIYEVGNVDESRATWTSGPGFYAVEDLAGKLVVRKIEREEVEAAFPAIVPPKGSGTVGDESAEQFERSAAAVAAQESAREVG